MTVAEKLQKIAENDQAVAEGVESLNAELEQTLYGTDTGGKSFYDAFWDAFQDYGNRRYYYNAFSNSSSSLGWTDLTYNPKYNIITDNGSASNLFNFCGFTDTKVEVDLSLASAAQAAFQNCRELKTIRKLTLPQSTTASTTSIFFECQKLESIDLHGEVFDSLDFGWSSKLGRETIIRVVNALSTEVSGKFVRFTRSALNAAFDGGTESAEWQALIAPKNTWSFTVA